MRSFYYIFMFLSFILALSTANADWDDITILQDAEISEGDQYVRVFVQSPDTPTTVDVTGGKIGTLFAYDDSIINVTGGVFSPEFYSYHPENNDGDNLMLCPSRHSIYLKDSSVLNYYGADFQKTAWSQNVSCAHRSTMNIYDGIVGLYIIDNPTVNIMGGEITGIGWSKSFPCSSQECGAELFISGGTFSGKVSFGYDTVAHIYGYGFEYDPNGWSAEIKPPPIPPRQWQWSTDRQSIPTTRTDGTTGNVVLPPPLWPPPLWPPLPRPPKITGGQLQGFWADGTAFSIDFTRVYRDDSYSHVVLHEVPRRMQIDIRPQSCPNPVNLKSKGVFDVAILGTDNFDVRDIDLSTVSLEGVAPLRSRYKDETTPVVDGQECQCRSKKKDGILDLTMKFNTEQIVAVLGEVEDGQEWLLHLTGQLNDGTEIEGTDCILIKNRNK